MNVESKELNEDWLKHVRRRPSATTASERTLDFTLTAMVSLARTIRSIRRVGLKEWWHQMQYIGDAKSGAFMGKDQ